MIIMTFKSLMSRYKLLTTAVKTDNKLGHTVLLTLLLTFIQSGKSPLRFDPRSLLQQSVELEGSLNMHVLDCGRKTWTNSTQKVHRPKVGLEPMPFLL